MDCALIKDIHFPKPDLDLSTSRVKMIKHKPLELDHISHYFLIYHYFLSEQQCWRITPNQKCVKNSPREYGWQFTSKQAPNRVSDRGKFQVSSMERRGHHEMAGTGAHVWRRWFTALHKLHCRTQSIDSSATTPWRLRATWQGKGI